MSTFGPPCFWRVTDDERQGNEGNETPSRGYITSERLCFRSCVLGMEARFTLTWSQLEWVRLITEDRCFEALVDLFEDLSFFFGAFDISTFDISTFDMSTFDISIFNISTCLTFQLFTFQLLSLRPLNLWQTPSVSRCRGKAGFWELEPGGFRDPARYSSGQLVLVDMGSKTAKTRNSLSACRAFREISRGGWLEFMGFLKL